MENKIIEYTNEYISQLQSISSKCDNSFTVILPEDLYFELQFEVNRLLYCRTSNSWSFNTDSITVQMNNGSNVEFKKVECLH